MSQVPYASSVHSLMYVMVFTRLNISHVEGGLRIYMSKTRKNHCIFVKRVSRYLCGTTDYAICYQGRPGPDRVINVHGFVDAD